MILGERKMRLLKRCIENQNKEMLWIIEDKKEIVLNETIANKLRELLGNELVENGLNGDEPSEYGLEIEELIDIIGQMVWERQTVEGRKVTKGDV